MNITFFKGIWISPNLEERALEYDTKKMKEDGVNIFAIPVMYSIEDNGKIRLILTAKWDGREEEGYLNMIRMAHNAGLAVF